MGAENIGLFQSIMKNTWAFLTIVVLVFCSFISIWLIIERYLRFRQGWVNAGQFMNRLAKLLKKNGKFDREKIVMGLDLCNAIKGPLAAVIKEGLLRSACSKEEMEENMQKTALIEIAKLEKHLVIIGSIGSVAPFIGLLGTVIGVTESFRTLSGGITSVGAGIAQALVATIVGLFVAIPAVIGYNFLVSKVEEIKTDIMVSSVELINIIQGKDSVKGAEDAGSEK